MTGTVTYVVTELSLPDVVVANEHLPDDATDSDTYVTLSGVVIDGGDDE